MRNRFLPLTDNRNVKSEPTSGRQSGTATPKEPKDPSPLDDLKTLVSSSTPSPKPSSISRFSKAIKSDIVIAAPEADKAKKEHRERGQVKMDVYKQYIISGGVWAFILLGVFTCLYQLFSIGAQTVQRN